MKRLRHLQSNLWSWKLERREIKCPLTIYFEQSKQTYDFNFKYHNYPISDFWDWCSSFAFIADRAAGILPTGKGTVIEIGVFCHKLKLCIGISLYSDGI